MLNELAEIEELYASKMLAIKNLDVGYLIKSQDKVGKSQFQISELHERIPHVVGRLEPLMNNAPLFEDLNIMLAQSRPFKGESSKR